MTRPGGDRGVAGIRDRPAKRPRGRGTETTPALNIGALEIVLILVIALLVIGPDGLPDAVRKVARFLGELRRYGEEVQEEMRAIIDESAATSNDEEPGTRTMGGSSD